MSKGKYKETFYNEEIMQVGTVLINTLTNKVVKFLEEDTTKFAYKAETTSRFLTVDPLAEEYYSWSPYVYVGNNPIKRIDPTGMDWYEDKDGSYQYDPKINKNSKLGEGQKYIGVTATVNDAKGNAFATFRKDGSIMFANEGGAYARMVTNTQKTGNEEMAVIGDKEVLVLPSYLNEKTESYYKEYGYSFKNGNVIDPLSGGREFSTVATAHTHPTGGDMTGDVGFARLMTPQKPMFALSTGGAKNGNISYIISSGKLNDFRHTNVTSQSPSATVSTLVSGRMSLRSYSKSIIKAHMGTGIFKLW